MKEEVIYQETNPYGSYGAFLEDDGRTIYLYLQSIHNPETEMKALWIQNRIPAPISRSMDDSKQGLAPYLCKDEIMDSSPIAALDKNDLHFIWTEEGDGVALFYKEKLLAFLPPWAGIKNVSGYSRYAKIDSITANPLGDPDHGVLAERIEASRKFWEYRATPDSWKEIQALRMQHLESLLGPHQKYWSADGGKFPHLAIAKFNIPDSEEIVLYSTLGMSAQNMPTVELYHKEYEKFSKIELVFAFQKVEGLDSTEAWVPSCIGDLIKYPWNMGKWYGEGHTITMPRRDPEALHLNFTHFFLTTQPPNGYTKEESIGNPIKSQLFTANGQNINFLFALPITDEDVHYIRSQGAKSFLSLMESNKMGWFHNSERESLL